jgi:hypothetical protein
MGTAADIVFFVPDNVITEDKTSMSHPLCESVWDSQFFVSTPSIANHYPQASIFCQNVSAC